MAVHQCPLCELKFAFRSEVEAHLATDHRPVQRPAPADDRDTSDDSGVEAADAGKVLAATTAGPR